MSPCGRPAAIAPSLHLGRCRLRVGYGKEALHRLLDCARRETIGPLAERIGDLEQGVERSEAAHVVQAVGAVRRFRCATPALQLREQDFGEQHALQGPVQQLERENRIAVDQRDAIVFEEIAEFRGVLAGAYGQVTLVAAGRVTGTARVHIGQERVDVVAVSVGCRGEVNVDEPVVGRLASRAGQQAQRGAVRGQRRVLGAADGLDAGAGAQRDVAVGDELR
jgi:hypothetical protein